VPFLCTKQPTTSYLSLSHALPVPLHPFSLPFPFLIFNYTDPPGVDPGKPGKPGTRSLDRVTSQVGFKNYASD